MEKLRLLGRIKELYDQGVNIIQYLKNLDERKDNTTADILISYDIQAGIYTRRNELNSPTRNAYCAEIAETLEQLGGDSLLEVGVGEASTLGTLLGQLKHPYEAVYGFDLSWSRILYAQKHLDSLSLSHPNITLLTGDLFHPPFQSDSIDIVYTAHSLEPNGGKEKESIQALYRICKKYLVLIEPGYELADEEARARMLKHGFVTNLRRHVEELGYEIVEHKQLKATFNPLNPSGMIVIKKDSSSTHSGSSPLACPVTAAPLEYIGEDYFAPDSLLAYPTIKGIPCLLPENAIIATHFLDD